jgi:hypothetical protein
MFQPNSLLYPTDYDKTPFNIEKYLDELPENTTIINVSGKELRNLPDLNRFKNLQELHIQYNKLTSLPKLPDSLVTLKCYSNYLTSLPNLPNNLKVLICSTNFLTQLPILPKTLTVLYCQFNTLSDLPDLPENLLELLCSNNYLTSLPKLPKRLKKLYCHDNRLRLLPSLPIHLQDLYCHSNELTYLPQLHRRLQHLFCQWNKLASFPDLPTLQSHCLHSNPVYNVVGNLNLTTMQNNIRIINRFVYLYYCLKFKHQFRTWLWEKVRKPKIEQKYHPSYLISNLDEDADLDMVLMDWTK